MADQKFSKNLSYMHLVKKIYKKYGKTIIKNLNVQIKLSKDLFFRILVTEKALTYIRQNVKKMNTLPS